MKQDLVSWYDNNINHPQRSLKQFAGDFLSRKAEGRRLSWQKEYCFLPSAFCLPQF
ncbi:MAG: hypothetical protein V7K68_03795 [Nostoc sp.]|uniref:hypothetical protein n=1 Tax=Nostoc sp. TaxID=1180 RepID=UPI002FFA368A